MGVQILGIHRNVDDVERSDCLGKVLGFSVVEAAVVPETGSRKGKGFFRDS